MARGRPSSYNIYSAGSGKNYFGGNVGVGRSSPLAALDVNGTVSASDAVQIGMSSLTCGAGIAGALRYNSGSIELCNGSAWGAIGGGGGGATDNITSGSTKVTVNSATSTISFTTNGSVANYIDSSGRLITTGVSVTTNQLSATTGYFSGKVGIGMTAPNAPLTVIDPAQWGTALALASNDLRRATTSKLILPAWTRGSRIGKYNRGKLGWAFGTVVFQYL